MSLGSKKGVRVTGKYLPPVDLSKSSEGVAIFHSSISPQKNSEASAIVSIVPLPQMSSEQAGGLKVDEHAGVEDWKSETSSQTRALFSKMGVHRQNIEELQTILKYSPLLQNPEREDRKTGGPYTYLHEIRSSRGGADGREDNGNHNRTFSTFKPQLDATRRGASSRDSSSIQLPPTMDSSSSFRPTAKTSRLPGVRTNGHSNSSCWGETADSHSGQNSALFLI